jgi:hypothetical protein
MAEVGTPFIGLEREESGRAWRPEWIDVAGFRNEVGEGDLIGQHRFGGGGEATQMTRLPRGTGGQIGAQRDDGNGRKGLAVAAAGNG